MATKKTTKPKAKSKKGTPAKAKTKSTTRRATTSVPLNSGM